MALDLDSFFARHGGTILKFEIRIGGKKETIDFSKEFILGEYRNDPFAISRRLDEAASKVAFYGTLYSAAIKELKDLEKDFKKWYAPAYKMTKARILLELSNRDMAAGLKKSPTEDEVEMEVSLSEIYALDFDSKQVAIAEAEKRVSDMKLLFDCAKIDADSSKSLAYLEDTIIKKGLLEVNPRKDLENLAQRGPSPVPQEAPKPASIQAPGAADSDF